MAERRMFAKTIVLSDEFLDMPLSARCLYFTLGMVADDDGFVNSPKAIMRQCGASVDDMNVLLAKKFLLQFEDGVIVIKHWRVNNYLRNDRYKETVYVEHKNELGIKENGSYTQNSAHGIPGIPNMGIPSIGKDSIGKDRIGEDNPYLRNAQGECATECANTDAQFEQFWCAYPKKKDKARARKAWDKVDVPMQTILDAVEKQKKTSQWMREDGRYIPLPTSWLNGRRWEDEVDEENTDWEEWANGTD